MHKGFDQPARRLVSQDDSARIEANRAPRSKFVGSWTRKTTIHAGYLVPIMVDEVLPGDHMSYRVTAFLRMATPLFPILDSQRIDTFFFFVPCRLVWDNWQKFMGQQENPTSSINFTIPQLQSPVDGYQPGDIGDHMGLPTVGQIASTFTFFHNVLPFRAYNLIYNEWFRDQNLVDSAPLVKDNGPDLQAYYVLRKRAKSHDYFTSALPWTQKFITPVMPLGGLAPVRGIGITQADATGGGLSGVKETGGVTRNYGFYGNTFGGAGTATGRIELTAGVNSFPMVYADLASATGITVNTLRQAFMLQALVEKDARGGTRYTELIKNHFGVINPDFRLQRPEYIGGGQSPLNITPIAQTAPDAGTTVGALGGTGTSAGQHRASYAATEHGYIIGLINVRTELSYQQGIHRMWSRSTRYDFYWPSLAGLGEQAILRKEIYASGETDFDNLVFGYQERWHEYRTRYSDITGFFRSTTALTLDAWHLAQKFLTPPTLGQAFIEDSPPMARVLAAGELADNAQYLCDIQFHRTAIRPLPMFGTPATLGRF